MGVVNINDVGKLSAELHVPHISEHDAISARATVSIKGVDASKERKDIIMQNVRGYYPVPCVQQGVK